MMKKIALLVSGIALTCFSVKGQPADFSIVEATATRHASMEITVFEIEVRGAAGATVPAAAGQLNGAPVLGYVFPTTLNAVHVGFSSTDGIVALALTSHPDFDDTPLWDENTDRDYGNDGVIWHPHWVVLQKDNRVEGGFSVKEFSKNEEVILPPTNPGMPMYMDSPGFQVVTQGNFIRVIVPDYRIQHQTSFNFDAVTCFMKVNTEDQGRPLLGVYEVYDIASEDLSLPYIVQTK